MHCCKYKHSPEKSSSTIPENAYNFFYSLVSLINFHAFIVSPTFFVWICVRVLIFRLVLNLHRWLFLSFSCVDSSRWQCTKFMWPTIGLFVLNLSIHEMQGTLVKNKTIEFLFHFFCYINICYVEMESYSLN